MGYLADYQAMTKRHGGNIVKDLSKHLKDIDAHRGSPNVVKDFEKAAGEVKKAITSLREFARKNDNKAQKLAAQGLIVDLQKMEKKLEADEKETEKDAKAAASGPSPSDLKDAAAKIAALTKLQAEWKKEIDQYESTRNKLWEKMQQVVADRWAAIKEFAKGYKVSIAGYPPFPAAARVMAEDCASAKSGFSKGLKGDKQVAGIGAKEQKEAEQKEAKEQNSLEGEFIEFAQGKVRGSLSEVNNLVAIFNKLLPALERRATEIKKIATDLNKELNDIDDSPAALKCSRAALALSTATGMLPAYTAKAQGSVGNIWKIVNSQQGLGKQDGDFRDVYATMPEFKGEWLNRELDKLFAEFKSFKA